MEYSNTQDENYSRLNFSDLMQCCYACQFNTYRMEIHAIYIILYC